MGSVTAITNASAEVVWKSEYQPFGTTAGIQGTYEFDGGYTGKDVDDATGLIYMWHRWQDPSTGSFISEDPIQAGNNWYSYCDGNPVSRLDPTGLEINYIVNKTTQTMSVYFKMGGTSIPILTTGRITTAVMMQNENPNTTQVNVDNTRWVTDGSSKIGYRATQFPNGTWDLSFTKFKNRDGVERAALRADQALVNTLLKTGDMKKLGGFLMHFIDRNNTHGCIGIKDKDLMNLLITLFLVDKTLLGDISKLIVVGGDQSVGPKPDPTPTPAPIVDPTTPSPIADPEPSAPSEQPTDPEPATTDPVPSPVPDTPPQSIPVEQETVTTTS